MGVYAAGALFALGWWFFLDASILSAHAKPPIDAPFEDVPTHVRFADWIPGLFSSLGMIIVNLIDKTKLVGEDDGFTSGRFGMGGVAWKARLFLFLGFALMAGGLAGSVCVLIIKYIVPHYTQEYVVYWGICNVIQNACIMFSASILWMAQNTGEDYEYNLTL